jgi:hypothetical protein
MFSPVVFSDRGEMPGIQDRKLQIEEILPLSKDTFRQDR